MKLIVVYSDDLQISITKFMQACDMFSSDKVISKAKEFDIVTESKDPLSIEENDVEKLVESMRGKGFRIIAFFIPGNPNFAWRDETINAISNGYQWCTLDSALEQLGFPEVTA
jgi:hypothetical protein